VGGVAQGIGSEFKPQYHNKKKTDLGDRSQNGVTSGRILARKGKMDPSGVMEVLCMLKWIMAKGGVQKEQFKLHAFSCMLRISKF
jgi:hypothetical protein